nr:MAG TPA: hypothetical protein [Caudoviricetes sp.]
MTKFQRDSKIRAYQGLFSFFCAKFTYSYMNTIALIIWRYIL